MGFFDNLINKFASSDGLPHVTAEDLRVKIHNSEKFLLLDIRTDEELQGDHKAIDGVVHVPIDHLPDSLNILSNYHETDIVLICKSGNRARIAGRFLHKKGFENVFVLDGGMDAWVAIDHTKPPVIPIGTPVTRDSTLKQAPLSAQGTNRKASAYVPKPQIASEVDNLPFEPDQSTSKTNGSAQGGSASSKSSTGKSPTKKATTKKSSPKTAEKKVVKSSTKKK